MGDDIGAIPEVNLQENLHDLVLLRLCHMIGVWRQFIMIRLAILIQNLMNIFPEIIFDLQFG